MYKKARIGKHILYFGDCLEVMPNLDAIDLIVTDPPYGINYKSNLQTGNRRDGTHKIVRDKNYFDEIEGDNEFPTEWIKNSYKILKDRSGIYIFCHWKTCEIPRQELLDNGFKLKNLIVLYKSNHGMGDLKGSYAPKYEFMWFASKGRHLLNFPNGREKDVWEVPVIYSAAIRLHPNRKPVSWMLPAIINSSNENDVVLDPFMGVGSTGEACIKTGRKFIGIEKDEKYFRIAYKLLKSLVENTDDQMARKQ